MIILTLRTDKPEAEISLFDGERPIGQHAWTAHRQLAETIHTRITGLLSQCNHAWKDIEGVVVYKGPGSFTGLRIGLSVANAIAYGLELPLVAGGGSTWQSAGIRRLLNGENDHVAMPDYGAPVHVTAQRK